jgi:hypothetical protein
MSATAALEERMTRRVVRGHVNKIKYKYKRYYASLKSVTQADATSCRRGIETHPFGAENWQVVPRDLGARYTVCSTAVGRRCFLLARTLIQIPVRVENEVSFRVCAGSILTNYLPSFIPFLAANPMS